MSSTVCEEPKFHNSRQLLSPKKSPIGDVIDNIPPQKLLTRRATACDAADVYSDSPWFSSSDKGKFLPYNKLMDGGGGTGDAPDAYSSDYFRMYEFKVRRCTRSRSHDWTDCPLTHPGEKARRRDPRLYHYSSTFCSEYRRGGGCSRGDACEYAHGVFECWLHPARYRTEACKDGKNCKRKVCFFAHTPRQLRILPVNCSNSSSPDRIPSNKNEFSNPSSGSNNCCLFCHCSAFNSSPTSTLFGMSHLSPPLSPSSSPVSPPLSPVKRQSSANGVSPISRYNDRFGGSETYNHGVSMNYKDVLAELMSSMKEDLNFNEASSSPAISSTTTNKPPNLPWLDVSNFHRDEYDHFILSPSTSFNCEEQQQFILSPISQTPIETSSFSSSGTFSSRKIFCNESRIVCADPDVEWVNDLVM